MKIQDDPRLPLKWDYVDLRKRLTILWRDLAQQVNGLSEGAISASYNAQTAAPTQGTYGHGDFIPNKEPTELGSTSSKYIITGWTCVAAGSPGTWVETRALTGN